ncbi:MAG TPA: DUF899 family protein [Rudaea sp.]|jgi:predicted dithiol-disulfide oxidoreductase (DUF899 family)|nr:DUF899 family protein [Rudaea sp.]
MSIQFADESTEYRKARDELLDAEIALRRQMQSVADQRQKLPTGPAIKQDYAFDGLDADGKPSQFKLSQLFRDGSNTLLIYHYMFPRHPKETRPGTTEGKTASLPVTDQPCPSCTAILDQIDAAVPHYESAGKSFAVVAKTSLDRMRDVANERGWRNMRLISARDNTFKRDYLSEDKEGSQIPLMTVFKREADGTIRLFWASELSYAPRDPGQDERAIGTLETFWNMVDLGPGKRPDFQPQLDYGCCHGHR